MQLAELNERFWEWMVWSWDGDKLTLVADNDLSYHHEAEVEFGGVEYVVMPDAFSHPRFRAATVAEVARVEALLGPLKGNAESGTIWAWDAETANGSGSFLIVANNVNVRLGRVAHQ